VFVICRASKAQQEDLFKEEIIPVNVKHVDKDGNESHVVVCDSKDNGNWNLVLLTIYIYIYIYMCIYILEKQEI